MQDSMKYYFRWASLYYKNGLSAGYVVSWQFNHQSNFHLRQPSR